MLSPLEQMFPHSSFKLDQPPIPAQYPFYEEKKIKINTIIYIITSILAPRGAFVPI